MAKYRKKPVVIDAVQWTGGVGGDRYQECVEFLGESYGGNSFVDDSIAIRTLEGVMSAPVGHWLIRGVKGEHYSCAPDIFTATYEPAD